MIMNLRKEYLREALKKIGVFFLTLLAISLLTFLLVKLSPGDPAINYLRASRIGITDETISAARAELGLDKPLVRQYIDWLLRVLRGDFGKSYLKKIPVLKIITDSLGPTLQLGLTAFALLFVLSLSLGISSALAHGKTWDYLVQGFSFICASIPTFWLGYMLIILFAVILKLLPVSGRGSSLHIILPCLTLVTPLIGQTSLLIRKSILEQMRQPHVTNAVLRGVSKKFIIFNHLLRNASIPILTVLGTNIFHLITGSVLIEEVFAWPGIGKMFVSAVKGGDLPVIQGSLLLFGFLTILVNALIQQGVHLLDPHLKIKNRGAYHEEE